jgi:integrase
MSETQPNDPVRKKKRGQNEGSIFFDKSRNRYVALVSGDNGKRKKITGIKKSDVQKQLSEMLRENQNGMLHVGPSQTVKAYLSYWLENVAEEQVRPRTFDRYKCLMERHVIHYLGTKRLEKLSAQDLQALYKRLGQGTEERKALHPRTVGHVHRCLHKAVEDAMRMGLVPRNVCDLVSPPKVPKPTRQFFTQEEARAFLSAVEGHRFEGLFKIALFTGMRQGELLALRWSDIRLNERVIYVRRSVYRRRKHGWVFSDPKSANSTRKIDVDESAIKALRHHRARQLQERLLKGDRWEDNDLVFPNTLGRPVRADNFLKDWFYPLLEKSGLPKIRFHDLRHSCASLLLELGVQPKVVQELLGHSSIAITMDIYSHVMPNIQKDALDLLGKALAK